MSSGSQQISQVQAFPTRVKFVSPKPAKRVGSQPGAGYFALTELNELNSGYYHDTCHALEVADLVKEMALALGRTEQRAEFLKQVALIHDADPRLCNKTGECQAGTPARVQVTITWMEFQRATLEKRFGWEGNQFDEACALIARTDFPFDRAPRSFGTPYDGMSPVELYRERLWKLPREARQSCFTDALVLRFADQISCYISNFERAKRSVRDLADELQNAGVSVTFEGILENTPKFLNAAGRDTDYDFQLREELNLPQAALPDRQALVAALGWKKRSQLAWNGLKFRMLNFCDNR